MVAGDTEGRGAKHDHRRPARGTAPYENAAFGKGRNVHPRRAAPRAKAPMTLTMGERLGARPPAP